MIILGICWFKLYIIAITFVCFFKLYIYLIHINFKLYIIPYLLSYICFKFLSVNALVENHQDLQECFSFRVMGGQPVTSPLVFYSRLHVATPVSAGSPRACVQPYIRRRPDPTTDDIKPARTPYPRRPPGDEPTQQGSLSFQSSPAASAPSPDFGLQDAGPGPAPPRNAAACSPGEKDVAGHAAAAAATAPTPASAAAATAAAAGPC